MRDYTLQSKIYPILRRPVYVIILFSQKSIPLWGDLTMWLYPKKWNPSHSERTWLCDCILGFEIYPILRGPDYVIILFSQKSIPLWRDLIMWLYFPAKIPSHSEGTWLIDYTFQTKIYPILRGPVYAIILFSQKSIPLWGYLTMWLYPKKWNPSQSEGTWPCDCNLGNEIYRILRGPDYVIILFSQKSIPFWRDLTMWLYFPAKNLFLSECTWLWDYTFQPKI